MQKRTKVIVAGHACLDITPIFPRNATGDLLIPGKLIEMEGVEISAGGAVSNTGIAMKLLGAEVSLLTKTGADEFGSIIKNIYDGYGVGAGVRCVSGERTSYTTVLAMPGVDRIFLHDPGCNHTFCADDVKCADLSDVALFHFGYPPIMRRMYQDGGRELVELLRHVKAQGAITSLDMAAVDPNSEAGQADWDAILRKALPYVDIFVPSVEELCFMLDRTRFDEWTQRAHGGELVHCLTAADIAPLAQTCIDYGARVLLLKCGAPGLFYQTAAQSELTELCTVLGIEPSQWADRVGFECSYVPEKVLSATGAGDTTIAAFLVSMLRGNSLARSVQLAAAEGASCVEAYGALGGLRGMEELAAKIDAGWPKGAGLAEGGNGNVSYHA